MKSLFSYFFSIFFCSDLDTTLQSVADDAVIEMPDEQDENINDSVTESQSGI